MNEHITIYVVFKTHFDIGFTNLAENVIHEYGEKMLPDVIKTCEGTQYLGDEHQYVWTMSAWPLLQSLKPDITENEIVCKAKELIQHGQIVWHALPFTTHTEFCGLEEFIRGMYFSRQLSKEYGKWPISAKMTDVPGHTWILPSLLHNAGVKFLHLGSNPACVPPDVPRLFYWEGPDKNRVLTFYNKGYGSPLIPPNDWNFPIWLALMQTNDNMGPQGPEVIEKILEDVDDQLPGAKVVVGTMDDFYKEMELYPLDNIPVIRGDLADTWIHGIGSYPKEVSALRELRNKLTETEKLLSLATMFGIINNFDQKNYKVHIDNAFEKSILFGEHTWGLDVKSTIGYNRRYSKKEFIADRNLSTYRRMEKSWNEQRQRVECAENEVNKILLPLTEKLTGLVNNDTPSIVAFNGLGWKRNAWIDLGKFELELNTKCILDTNCKEPVETAYIEGKLKAYVKDLPAFGYKTLSIKAIDFAPLIEKNVFCDANLGVIENEWYRIEVDTYKGGIKRLKDKSTGKEWLTEKYGYAFGQYRYDIYGIDDITEFIRSYTYRFYDWIVNDLGRMSYPEQEHLTFSPKGYTIESEQGTASASLIMRLNVNDQSVDEYGNARKISTRITLYRNQPFIDMTFNLNNKEETPYIEAGHFVFPINLQKHQTSINKLGCVINPEKDIVRDANNLLYCCENWVDVSDGENGIAIIPYDTPLFSIGDEAICKFKHEYIESEPVLFFNAFNNSWGTNFPQWMGGDYTFKYRIITHRGDWEKSNIAKLAMETVTNPLVGYKRNGNTFNALLPQTFELIHELDGMEIMTLKLSENGEGLIIRLREIYGIARNVNLILSNKCMFFKKCDLIERTIEVFENMPNKLTFNTASFEIHTFLLKFSEFIDRDNCNYIN